MTGGELTASEHRRRCDSGVRMSGCETHGECGVCTKCGARGR